jgi:Tol biopolymer transport system component
MSNRLVRTTGGRLLALCTVCLLLLGALHTPAQAQAEQQCFSEVPYCIEGQLLQFWRANGALPVFGLPISEQRAEEVEGQTRTVQWFERNRLELAPDGNVQLGRLGVAVLEAQGRNWFTFEQDGAPQEGCQYFPETGQNVCGPILERWQSEGLEQDGIPGSSFAESLALFGLPISQLQVETLSDGQEYQVQWFERARFEVHPENPPESRVLLGLLGRELLDVGFIAPGSPPAEPAPEPEPPAEPAPQPQETPQVVFHSLRNGTLDVFIVDINGQNLRQLTTNIANDAFPVWSPDGSRIAFVSDRDGNLEIYVINVDGTGLTRVTTSDTRDERPTWSPDSSLLAYVSDRDGNPEIYVSSLDGAFTARLTNNPDVDSFPEWSPDGSRIAYASNAGGDYEIYTMNADGSDKRQLTDNEENDAYPTWSPDGNRLAFGTGREGKDSWDLYTMNADGSNEQSLFTDGPDAIEPAWSPDGNFVAYQTNRDANWEIYVMNVSSLEQRRLTAHPARDAAPAWAP